jgi:2-methylisocitrate lyase-like PEP mutase family enzyme
MDTQKKSARLKSLVARRDAIVLPGTPNALFARVIETMGFPAAYVTGAGIANMQLGVPDIGLTSVTEIADAVSRISDVVSIPLLVDGDTGFGNPVNVIRTIRLFEKAGASGIQMEDQVFPKKCGHFEGKDVISLPEMVQKIKAAVDARVNGDFQIVARTDARATHGLNHAIDRAHAFVEAGADVIFVEAPLNAEETIRIAREIAAPKIINIVHGGLTPTLPLSRYKELGFSFALFANAVLQAALKSATDVLNILKDEGSLKSADGMLASFEVRQNAVNKGYFDELEKRYATPAKASAAIRRGAS